jgi:putative alpha-1,2-mannosidase
MYAYDDWALSVVAAAAGEADVQQAFVARSKNYRRGDPRSGSAVL